MAAKSLAKFFKRGRLAKLSARFKNVLIMAFFATFLTLGFGYHIVVWLSGEPPTQLLSFVYNVVVLAGYGSLWLLLSQRLQRRRAQPFTTFWTTLVLGIMLMGLTYGVVQFAKPPVPDSTSLGFDIYTGVPLTFITALKMNMVTLLAMTFIFIVLLRFRDLVLFKRTKSSERNWYLMLGFMALTGLAAFMKHPDSEIGPIQAVPMIPAVVFMVINSFRLSWIVQLSFKDKMAVIGLSLLLLGMLAAVVEIDFPGMIPGISVFLDHYSFPLKMFWMLGTIFGILYCTTAFLSLLFHLPTTGDFKRKVDEMAAMHSLTNLVNQVFDLEQLVATITASPVEAGSADASWLMVADPETGSLRPRVIATHNIHPTLIAELIDTKALYQEIQSSNVPLLLEQASADHRVSARPGDGLSSLLITPLTARDEVLGALFVSREVTHGFEKDDREAISIFAAQAALALDNARLFEEQIEKERLARELTIAREVQHKLLPQQLPKLNGLNLAASSVSAHEVGGDYYDFVKLDENRMAFIVGDVSGKGTSAAFYMAEMQGVFKSVSHLAPDPLEFLSHANRALATSLEKNVFISVIYGLIDLEKEELLLARAGHCPAAFINLNGDARYVRTQGLGLGLDRGPLFRKTLDVECIRLQPGDVFVFYTDGVVESRSPAGEEYGYDRLLDALRKHRHEDANELHDVLLTDLDTFLGGLNLYDDDLTLVVLKWQGITLPQTTAVVDSGNENSPIRTATLE